MSKNNKDSTLILENKPTANGNDLVVKMDDREPVIIPNTKVSVDGETIIVTGSGIEVKDGALIIQWKA